jgi:hypothetical protein
MELAIDTPQILTKEQIDALVKLGVKVIIKYPRADRVSRAEIAMIRVAGLKIIWVFERGNPTQPGYFTAKQAAVDVALFKAAETEFGIAADECCAAAYDFDGTTGEVLAYAKIWHDGIKRTPESTRVGAYADTSTLKALKAAGLIHWAYLSQSTFGRKAEWQAYSQVADVVQTLQPPPLGLDADWDHVLNMAVAA